MADLATFKEVSLYPDETFGLKKIDLSIKRGKKQLIYLRDKEKLNTLLGLLENRYHPQSGLIRKFNDYFIQSDRLIMGDRVIDKTVQKWLGLGADSFFFEGRKRSKFGFMEQLKMKHTLLLPLHKLSVEEKIKITLLSLLFQRSGLIIVSKLLGTSMDPIMGSLFRRILTKTGMTVSVVTTDDAISTKFDFLEEFIKTSLPEI